MRDIIWTIIIFWVIYKLSDLFRSMSKKSYVYQHKETPPKKEPVSDEARSALKKGADREGEYVDYEELR